MNLHHRPESIAAVVGDGGDLGVCVRYSWEQPRVLGSAGGPRHALALIDAPTFMIVNGDTLTDVDLAAVAASHANSGAAVTLALVPNREHHRYGGVRLDGSGAVTGFSKRGPESAGSWHFIGVQMVDASVFAPLPPGVAASSVGGVYDELVRTRPGAVRGFCADAAFWDIGTPADYLRTSRAFSQAAFDAGRRTQVDPSARLDGSILWDDVVVGAEASLRDCIVTDGVAVPARASYERAILTAADDGIVVTPVDAG
jgi:NDP-sugar pyrophosphorylase family protein